MTAGAPVRARFEPEFLPLRGEEPRWGEVAILPWDAEVFGFPVAEYRAGAGAEIARDPSMLRQELERWSARTGAELVGCRLPAESPGLLSLLTAAGFRFVELQLSATRPRLDRLEPRRLSVRRAEPADHSRIAEIAGSAFTFGRYHADPLFPRALASRRFRIWMERALADPSPGTWIGVLGPPGEPAGFVHAELDPDKETADIRLLATESAAPAAATKGAAGTAGPLAGLAGPALLLGSLHELAAAGASRAIARLSPANSAALNVYASLGFQFHDPAVVLHWSRPGAPHLLSAPPV